MAQCRKTGIHFSRLFVLSFSFCIFFSFSIPISSQAFAWADVRFASMRRTLSVPVVSLDQKVLSRFADEFRTGMAPVYAVSVDGGDEASEIVGFRDSHVWQATTLGRAISMERLGAMVNTADHRVRDAETGVLGARAILAYEDPVAGVLVTVLSAGKTLYSVVHQGNGVLSIVRIGSLAE